MHMETRPIISVLATLGVIAGLAAARAAVEMVPVKAVLEVAAAWLEGPPDRVRDKPPALASVPEVAPATAQSSIVPPAPKPQPAPVVRIVGDPRPARLDTRRPVPKAPPTDSMNSLFSFTVRSTRL
jgi:hypothetical protein